MCSEFEQKKRSLSGSLENGRISTSNVIFTASGEILMFQSRFSHSQKLSVMSLKQIVRSLTELVSSLKHLVSSQNKKGTSLTALVSSLTVLGMSLNDLGTSLFLLGTTLNHLGKHYCNAFQTILNQLNAYVIRRFQYFVKSFF